MAMRWISSYCAHSKYILKVDDDVFVDIYRVKDYLKHLDNLKNELKKTIMCNHFKEVKVQRSKSLFYIYS